MASEESVQREHHGEHTSSIHFNLNTVSWLDVAATTVHATVERIRAQYPRLIPLVMCLGVMPLVILLSVIAGWTVWKSVPKGWSIPVHLQYGDGIPPYSELVIDSLSASQPYDISLHITVPATEANYALGNFMTSLIISTPKNATLIEVRKPSLVLPPSSSIISFWSRTPRLLEIIIPLVSSTVIKTYSVNARVEIGRRDAWKSLGMGEGRELSVHTAFLRGEMRPQGLRRIFTAFPVPLAIASSIIFFSVSTAVLVGFTIPSIASENNREEAIGTLPSDQTLDATGEEQPSSHAYPSPEPEAPLNRLRRRTSALAEI